MGTNMWIFGMITVTLFIGSNDARDLMDASSRSSDIFFLDNDNHEFDLLIFTQQWPVTTCIEWMAHGKGHSCLLPSPKEIWTIHGVWPTRFGSIGPAFCNRSAVFDPSQLDPFRDQMQQFWINIEKGQSLWQHEWLKHGTCAAVLPQLNDEAKYFGTGLSWLHKYSMTSILAKANLLPDTPHKLADIHAAVFGALKKNPSIHCVSFDKEVFLSEIRVCFNKSLEMVDCDNVKFLSDKSWPGRVNGPNIISNCNPDAPILYPNVVPPHRMSHTVATPAPWRFPFVEVYKLLDIVKWLTL